jgi:hypothetical protein
VTDPARVGISPKQHGYFDSLEYKIGQTITPPQRAWYIAQLQTLGGDEQRMWREFPSTPDEAFQVSLEGTYYAVQLQAARKQGRIARVPLDPSMPVNTFWDIGANDETAIWLHQEHRGIHRFVGFYEASGESFSHFVSWLQSKGCVWGTHFLPHDAEHKRQLGMRNLCAREMLEELAPGWRFEIVPRIHETIHGIQQTRDAFPLCEFDANDCKEGLAHLELYRKEWNDRLGTWRDHPRHDSHSNGADAFRQFGQALANEQIRYSRPQQAAVTASRKRQVTRNWRIA